MARKDAILLLGHGSRLTEANSALKQMAHLVREMGDVPLVEIAFLQFAKPDFFEGISTCVKKGAKKIIIHPYFLYKGRHFHEDIVEMIEDARRKYGKIEFILTEPLGVHENIAKVVLERAQKNLSEVKILKPHEIEGRSFEIISEEIGETNFSEAEKSVVKRVIHATGDFDFSKNMRFHPDAVKAGVKAIKKGKDILADVRMAEAGINKRLLGKWGGKVICNIKKSGVRCQVGTTRFRGSGERTRAEMGIEEALKENKNIGIVAIGNAPTALYRVMKLLNSSKSQILVIGVPVGFVKAQESKEVLLHMKYPFITSLGRKGGSPAAAAIVNALLKMVC